MRIGIEATTLLNPAGGEFAGVGYYTQELIQALLAANQTDEYFLFFQSVAAYRRACELFADQPRVKLYCPPALAAKKFLPFIYSQLFFAWWLKKFHLDIWHGLANTIPLAYHGRAVVTVHDLAIYRQPAWFPQSFWQRLWSTKVAVPLSLRRAQKIIADSAATKKDLQELLKVPATKVSVVPLAATYQKPTLNWPWPAVSDNYLLFVGTIEPRKNLLTLLTAYQSLAAKLAQMPQLVLAGRPGWQTAAFFQKIAKLNRQLARSDGRPAVVYLGYVSAAAKNLLLSRAQVFVYPSFYEGFGLPVLEALQAGLPVITANTTSLPEVAGTAACYIDPSQPAELAAALEKILTDPAYRQILQAAASSQAQKFFWSHTAQLTRGVYAEVVK